MKRKIIALMISAALLVSMLGIFSVQAAGLEVSVKEDGKFTVTVSGDTSANDWIGIYKEGEKYGEGEGTAKSLLWWYIDDTTKTVNWPEDKSAADNAAGQTINSAGNRVDEINEDFTLMPGKYYAIVLGGDDAYTPVEGFDVVNFEIKAASVPADPDYTSWEDYGKGVANSWDTIKLGDTQVSSNAPETIEYVKNVIDGKDGSITTISLSGWIGLDQKVTGIGYSVDGGVPVFVDDVLSNAEDAVIAAGGDNATRFSLPIDVSKLTGKHEIVVVVKLEDGTVVSVTNPSQPMVFSYEGPSGTANPTTPESGDSFTIATLAAVALMGICVLTVVRKRTNV